MDCVSSLVAQRELLSGPLGPLARVASHRVVGGEPRQHRAPYRISRGVRERPRALVCLPGLRVTYAARRGEGRAERNLQRDLALVSLLSRGQLGEQRECPAEVADRLLVRRAGGGLLTGALVVRDRRGGESRCFRVPRDDLGLGRDALGEAFFQPLGGARV